MAEEANDTETVKDDDHRAFLCIIYPYHMYTPELHVKVSLDWSTASATLLFERGEQFRVRSLRNKTGVSRIS